MEVKKGSSMFYVWEHQSWSVSDFQIGLKLVSLVVLCRRWVNTGVCGYVFHVASSVPEWRFGQTQGPTRSQWLCRIRWSPTGPLSNLIRAALFSGHLQWWCWVRSSKDQPKRSLLWQTAIVVQTSCLYSVSRFPKWYLELLLLCSPILPDDYIVPDATQSCPLWVT